MAALLWGLCASAHAQLQRDLPLNSLRGSMIFNTSMDVTLNGQAARLTPASRIHGINNLLVQSGSFVGNTTYQVNYMLDTQGFVHEVWLLSDAEAAQLWPTTAQDAANWTYDPVQHLWTRP